MKTNHASKITPERLAKMDDYELPAHIEVDYSKTKPNRFAKYQNHVRVIQVALPAMKEPSSEPLERHTILLYPSQVQALRKLNPSLSRAIRQVLETETVLKPARKRARK